MEEVADPSAVRVETNARLSPSCHAPSLDSVTPELLQLLTPELLSHLISLNRT